MRKYWSNVSSSGISSMRKTQIYWREVTEMKGWEPVCSEERPRELCLLSWRRLSWIWAVCELLKTVCKQGWSRLFSVVPSAKSRGHEHQLKHWRFLLNIRKCFFTLAVIPQGAQGGGAISLSMEILPSCLDMALPEPGVGWKRWRSLPTSSSLWFWEHLLKCILILMQRASVGMQDWGIKVIKNAFFKHWA